MFYKLIGSCWIGLMIVSAAHAGETMVITGEISNQSEQEVWLKQQSWDIGDLAPETLSVPAGEMGRFAFDDNSLEGSFDFALQGGRGDDKVVCLYSVRYGPTSYIRGAVHLTGPQVEVEATELPNTRGRCFIKVNDWDYKQSMDLQFVIESA